MSVLLTLWFVLAVIIVGVGLAAATWCYFDPDTEYYRDEKTQRLHVRRGLLAALAAPVWPLVLVVLLVVGLALMVKFAFPRVSEE